MPRQIFDAEKFLALAASASDIRVKRSPTSVKLKLRTPKMLYTYICDPETADSLVKKLPMQPVEF
ncbi:MAG TPA: 50S ribosomal protein L38e [Candidatus Lokiarchaeia archaeon]|nr:50S ribosomal protein L38e [Candidatus Lokiarchaeia archaeon]